MLYKCDLDKMISMVGVRSVESDPNYKKIFDINQDHFDRNDICAVDLKSCESYSRERGTRPETYLLRKSWLVLYTDYTDFFNAL